MEELKQVLRVVVANDFTMYFKTHSYHHNVEAMNFSELHGFFASLYEDLHATYDVASEELRALDEYAAISMTELYNWKTIEEDSLKPATARDMLVRTQDANEQMIESLNKLFEAATNAKKQGLADYAAGRLDVHAKHGWMLRSYLKVQQ
jgi:starvation-inducible DNA-binding protein